MYTYLIYYGDMKKILKLNQKTNLTRKIKETLNLQSQIRVRYFDESFEEWVDVDENTEIPDKCKITVEDCAIILEPVVVAAAPEVDDTFDQFLSSTAKVEDDISSWYKPDSCEGSSDGSSFATAFRPDNYPSPQILRHVGEAIVQTHPVLQDKFNFKGNAFGSWITALRNKFKELRRRTSAQSDIQKKMKQKYGNRKRKAQSADQAVSVKLSKSRIINENYADKNDSNFDIVQKMQDNPSDECMAETFLYRRQAILSGTSLDTITKNFPPLKTGAGIMKEFARVTGRTECMMDELKDNVTLKKACGINYFNTYFKLKQNDDIIKVLDNGAPSFILLPRMFKENWDMFFEIDKTPGSPYPTLCLRGEELSVMVDGLEITGIKDYWHGLAVMIGSYWVFNIEFPQKIKKTMSFLANYILKFREVEVTIPVINVINLLA